MSKIRHTTERHAPHHNDNEKEEGRRTNRKGNKEEKEEEGGGGGSAQGKQVKRKTCLTIEGGKKQNNKKGRNGPALAMVVLRKLGRGGRATRCGGRIPLGATQFSVRGGKEGKTLISMQLWLQKSRRA